MLVQYGEDRFIPIKEFNPASTLEELKCILETETQIPVAQQFLFHKGSAMTQNDKKLSSYGIKNQDILKLTSMSGSALSVVVPQRQPNVNAVQ